jgi:uncharacterized protein (TIGR01244 family)
LPPAGVLRPPRRRRGTRPAATNDKDKETRVQPVRINDKISVASQPDLETFRQFAADGFKGLINNRPDGEEARQPGTAVEERAAGEAGLAYAHIPVTGASLTEADVRAFQAALARVDGPVLAHCKGGTRSLALWVIGEVLDGRMRADEVRAFGERHGFDLRGAEAWLARHAGGR